MSSGPTTSKLDNVARRYGGEISWYMSWGLVSSELNLPRLEAAGIQFVRADVRNAEELMALESHDVLIESCAEPSVLAGYADARNVYVPNLGGAFNCLELARRDGAQMIFLSTSRACLLGDLTSLRLDELDTRFEIAADQELPGVSPAGIAESFPLAQPLLQATVVVCWLRRHGEAGQGYTARQ